MPFIFDFNVFDKEEIHTVEISPDGWNGPITIEYCVAQAHKFDTMLSVVWRVKGTTHCFTIEEQRINRLSHGGEYKDHFKKALEGFRKDYLSWFKEEEYKDCDWKYEYQKQYGRFIIQDKDN